VEGGVRVGDIIGRRELLLQGAVGGTQSVTGLMAGLAWRGWPLEVQVQGFGADERGPISATRAGGGVTLARDHRWSSGSVALGLGAVLDVPLAQDPSGVGDRTGAHVTIALRQSDAARRLWHLSVAGRGQLAGADGSRWERGDARLAVGFGSGSNVRLGYALGWIAGAPSALDRYTLGGVPTGVVPEALRDGRLAVPAFAPDPWSGRAHDAMTVEVNVPWTLFFERHRLWERAPTARGATVLGVRMVTALDRQPFFKLPALRTELGLGCRLEDPTLGFDRRPCAALDDYALWGATTWSL
jgi:hypothetical protein